MIAPGTVVRKKINGTEYEGIVLAYYRTLEGVPQIVVQCGKHTTFVSHPALVTQVNKTPSLTLGR